MSSYVPKPIETEHVEVPEGLAALVEQLAENSHDIWARQRLAEGWTHGPQRDDAGRKHPDLVAYADLPDGEKEYDRLTVQATIKAILALGYRIEKQ